jgi:addiction module HigA family antidote
MPEPTSPGEMLLEEWLKPLSLSQSELARRMDVHVQVVNQIVRGRRAITAPVAWRLSAVLKTTPQFWMNVQTAWDLWKARPSARSAS